MERKDLFQTEIKPMLAFPAKPFDSEDYIFEIKYDGTRTISYVDVENKSVRFLNRRGIYFEWRYPEITKVLLESVKANKVILDGEIVILVDGKPNFWKLQEREHTDDRMRIEILSELYPATFIVFDILYKDGEELISLPLMKRKEILKEILNESERVKISEFIVGEGTKFFQKVKELGLEGIMAKKKDSPYLIGRRSEYWLKIKVLKTVDCVICGYTKGEGAREKYFGALVLGCYEDGKLRYIGRVGTGFDESDLKALKEKLDKIRITSPPFDIFEEEPNVKEKMIFTKPIYVCEVKCMEVTKDKKLRAPVFLRLREDKNPEECKI